MRDGRAERGGQAMLETCECVDIRCLNADGHRFDDDCGQEAVMHLFRVAVEGPPVTFCGPCGDNALQSGAWATGEDIAAARRAGDWRP